MSERRDTAAILDDLFSAAREVPPKAPEDLLVRVMADADREQHALCRGRKPERSQSAFAQFCQALGGWPAISGMAAATCAGIWLGISPPQSIAFAAESYLGLDTVTPMIDMSVEGAFDLNTEAL